tara:strand:- start:97951 stop:99249 length:1299 start_codon:yes stop_codon:yes gene_type:complete
MSAPLDNPGLWMKMQIADLFPLMRSLTGEGTRETMRRLAKHVPFELTEVPSGTEAFDWTVPDEWTFREAWIEGPDGKRVVDAADHTLHLVNYSAPFRGEMDLAELKDHLYTRPDMPDAIPYVTSYYRRHWGFCLRHDDFEKLAEGRYKVCVDTTLQPGSMTYAGLVIPGESDTEILLSSYCCHPSMANNELSGPVMLTLLGLYLQSLPARRYTYRLVLVPETIGAITYLSKNLMHMREKLLAGLVVTCTGGPGVPAYIPTRAGDSYIDKLACHVMANVMEETRILDFTASSSDERRYNAPGVDLPVGSVVRTRYFDYPEYHTSKDDLDFVTPEQLSASFDIYVKCLNALEHNRKYQVTTLCEPNLGKRGLYPTVGGAHHIETRLNDILALCAYADGENDLVDIANIHSRPVWAFYDTVKDLIANGLLELAEE